jgi:heme O synthase-like polyprenyltransferase
MIYIYLAIGLAIFFVLQFVSSRAIMDSQGYQLAKISAWVSLPFWPFVGTVWVFGLLAFGACLTIEYMDKRIDKVMRKKK